jgi:peptidoglycan/LPS O-acetylase OafA/YrhL
MPQSPSNNVKPPGHYHWLDWLRFLAALWVVIGHTRFQHFAMYADMSIPHKGLWSEILFLIPRFANEAVTVFFVLSGYLVGGRALERAMAGRFDGTAYVIDRATRIWLPLIPCVFFTWAVTAIRGENINWLQGIGNIASVQGVLVAPLVNNTSLWSLSYEIWFYVAALAVGLLLNTRGADIRAPLILLALVFAVFIPLKPYYLFIWIFGALTHFLKPGRERWPLLAAGILIGGTGGLLSALAVEVKSIDIHGLASLAPKRDYSLLLLGLGVALTLPVLVRLKPSRPWLAKLDHFGTGLAAWSYSLYLVHRPVLQLWSHWHGFRPYDTLEAVPVLMYLVKIASCLAAGWLFWRLFENQTNRLRQVLKRRFLA